MRKFAYFQVSKIAQSAGAAEYNNCTPVKGLDPHPLIECNGYDTKQW